MNTFPIFHFKPQDSLVPPPLWEVPRRPSEIFVQGSEKSLSLLQDLPQKGLAIVGTRNPQLKSTELVYRSIQELAGTNLIIISGLAKGIDTAVHQACLENGLSTIAILGAGHQNVSPKSNAHLSRKIMESGGLLISEFAPSVHPRPFHFLQRNRLIAGWAQATLVVEASSRSGSLNTAMWAREQNRTCLAVPCFPNDLRMAGNQFLIDRECAFPFWGIHSLGVVWISLSTYSKKQASFPSHLSRASRPSIQPIVIKK